MKKAIVVDLSQIDAILLAAGASKRLGEPKALVDIHGESLIKLIIRKLKQNDLRIIIVTRKELVEEMVAGEWTNTINDFSDGRT